MTGSPASLTLPFSSEVRFVYFNLAAQKIVGFGHMSDDRFSNHGDRLERRGIADSELQRDLPDRVLEFEEYKNPGPCLRRDFDFIEPAAGEVMEGMTASGTPIFRTTNPVDFIAATLCAKNAAFSSAKTSQVEPHPIFCLNNKFEGIQVHGHHYNLA